MSDGYLPFTVALKSDANPQYIQKGFAMLMKVHKPHQAELICAAHTQLHLLPPYD